MKVTMQKNGDVIFRIKRIDLMKWRRVVALFLEAYIDPDNMVNLTPEEKAMIEFDKKLARTIFKFLKRK